MEISEIEMYVSKQNDLINKIYSEEKNIQTKIQKLDKTLNFYTKLNQEIETTNELYKYIFLHFNKINFPFFFFLQYIRSFSKRRNIEAARYKTREKKGIGNNNQ